jgi:hypothetical protein
MGRNAIIGKSRKHPDPSAYAQGSSACFSQNEVEGCGAVKSLDSVGDPHSSTTAEKARASAQNAYAFS